MDRVRTAMRQCLDPDGPSSQVVLAHLHAWCHAGETTHVPGDPTETAFREGKRAVFLHICALIAPELAKEPDHA